MLYIICFLYKVMYVDEMDLDNFIVLLQLIDVLYVGSNFKGGEV